MLGTASRAHSITDKQGLRNGRLWQAPIFSHLPVAREEVRIMGGSVCGLDQPIVYCSHAKTKKIPA